jgi:ABC-type antimicrobial peptide transport system permease subunit
MLASFFGLLAALLASVGLYGVISYLVASRRNELGIRMALGASRRQIITMVLREAWALLAAGILIGVTLSLLAGRAASSMLFGLKAYDPLTLLTAIFMLIFISLLASSVPAQRASKVDPMAALRCE